MWPDYPSMPAVDSRTEYLAALTARIRKLREAKGWTQAEMATALGVPEERYRKYENRSALPIYLVEKLSLITGRSIHFIVTGKEMRLAPVVPVTMAKRGRR